MIDDASHGDASTGPDWAEYRSEFEWQFLSVSDYIWKLPEFISHLRAQEVEKLNSYFPADYVGDDRSQVLLARELRMSHESKKIEGDFPLFLASSAFIHSLSFFEYHLLKSCKMLERSGAGDLNRHRGKRHGATGLLGYAADCEGALAREDVEIMRGAIALRNCLVHANGMVEESIDPQYVRKLVRNRSCYRPERTGGRRGQRGDYEPLIFHDVLGERLFVPIMFTHWLTAIGRNMLISICEAGNRLLLIKSAQE